MFKMGGVLENIKITLETLYDILRNEKKKEDLQKLESSFFADVINYLREKKSLLDLNCEREELFAAGEKEKVEYELRSIKRILKEIYEKREKKIIDIALNRSKTGSDIINTDALLREEKEFYKSILGTLDLFRRGILLNLFRAELPTLTNEGIKTAGEILSNSMNNQGNLNIEEKKKEIKLALEKSASAKFAKAQIAKEEKEENEEKTDLGNDSEEEQPTREEPKQSEEEEQKKEEEKLPVRTGGKIESAQTKAPEPNQAPSKVKIKFVHPTPSFIWKDMKVYGPYDAGEETEMFLEVAELLARKGRAKKI